MLGHSRKGSVLLCDFLNKALQKPQGLQPQRGGWTGCAGSPEGDLGGGDRAAEPAGGVPEETPLSWGQGSGKPHHDVGRGALGVQAEEG